MRCGGADADATIVGIEDIDASFAGAEVRGNGARIPGEISPVDRWQGPVVGHMLRLRAHVIWLHLDDLKNQQNSCINLLRLREARGLPATTAPKGSVFVSPGNGDRLIGVPSD
jgi:hypothetical protein